MASLNSNSISGITTDIFGNNHAVNKKYADDTIPILPDPTVGGGKFLVTTDGVSITWSDISNVEEFGKVGISTYYIPEMVSSIRVEGVGAGAAGNNGDATYTFDDSSSRLLYTCCNGFCMCQTSDVTYGNGKYLVAGTCDLIGSTDTIHWERKNVVKGTSCSSNITGVDYGAGVFLAGSQADYFCSSSVAVQASTDTTNWTTRTIANSNDSCCFCSTGRGGLKYLNNNWYLLDNCRGSLQVSTDSIHWALRTLHVTGRNGGDGGSRLTWSGSHYAFKNTYGNVTSSTDGIVWNQRTIPFQNSCTRYSALAFTYSCTANLWINAYSTYNNGQCPSGSGLYYGQHLITSTDTIVWTLRTLAFAADRPAGYTSAAGDYFTEVVDVGNRLYLSSFGLCDPQNFPNAVCSACTYFPLTSTDAIHWEGFVNAVGCDTYYVTANNQPYQCTCWSQYFKLNNRLFISADQCAAAISEGFGPGGNGGNAGDYALFSINPYIVKDRKLEINIGSGGATSTGTFGFGCAGAGTTISYLSQEGTTSYYFNGSSNSRLDTNAVDDLVLGTGDFTLEFFVNFSSADSTLDTVIETRSGTSTSDGFIIGRFHTSGHENKIEFFTGNDYRITADVTVGNNVWTHVAVVRSSSVTKMYVNGIAYSNTYSDSNNYSNNYLRFGKNASSTHQFDGYLSGIRIDKGLARYTSNFKPSSPDVQRGNKTVFLSGVGSTIADQTENTTISNTNVSLCTSTCLPEIKVNHTINGGCLTSGADHLSCSISPLKSSLGGLGQDSPIGTVQSFFNPFQASGGGAGANDGETGGNSGVLLNYSTEIKSTGGANPQPGFSFQSAVYGTGGGGGNPGVNGAPGFRGGGGGGGGLAVASTGYPAWTLRTSGFADPYSAGSLAPIFGVGYAYGQWLAAGQYNSYSTSTDSIHWISRSTGSGGGTFNFGFAYDGSSTLALGQENGLLRTSTDAIHFTARTTGVPKSSSNFYALKYFNNRFLSGHQNAQLQVSTDAIHWLVRTSGGDTSKDIFSFAYGAGKYVYGNTGGQIATSTDTIRWTQRTIGATTTNIKGLIYANSQYIAAGYGARISSSTDAIHWTTRTAGVPSGVGFGEIVYSNELYQIVSVSSSRIISSTDSIHWTQRTSNGGSFSYYANGMVNNGSEYIAGGSNGLISYLNLTTSSSGCGGKGGDGFARITWW